MSTRWSSSRARTAMSRRPGIPSKAEHGKVVPTWNYLMVQARGPAARDRGRAWLRAFVTRLTDLHEGPRSAPWAVADAPADYIETMLGAIVGIEIDAELAGRQVEGEQNRSVADRAGVVAGLERERGETTLAAQVREPGSGA